MDPFVFKLFAIVAIFVVGTVSGLMSFGAGRSRAGELYLSLGSALAAGVFLGAGLVHLMPDSVGALNGYFVGIEFPLGFLLTAVGFLFILFLEKILLAHGHDSPAEAGSPSSYALVIILSIHSVLAGAALGTENTLAGSAVLTLAILAHKGAAAFALMVDFQRAGFARGRSIALLVLFCAMTPMGILFGAVLDHFLEDRHGRLFEGMFDAVAAGTFIYIAILEIISKEFATRAHVAQKFLFVCLGLGLMAAIALFV